MEKSINYLGYTAQPSDYTRPDGELAAVMDLWHEGGQLKPVLQPQVVLNNLTATQRVLYVHKVSTDTHYIIYDSSSSTFYWIDSATPSVLRNMDSTGLSGSVIQVNSVGNTLLILTGSAIRYYLWKPDQSLGSYSYLGDHLPEMSLSFGLRSAVIEESETPFEVSFEEITDVTADFSEANKQTITEAVLANVNRFVANKAINEGKFIFPFFVRYAYRLFDGTITMQSAPILMMTNSGVAPSVFWKDYTSQVSWTGAWFFVAAPVCQLDYVGLASQATALQNWKDIVKSVDIFISAPLYTYDQSGFCKRFRNSSAESNVYSYSAFNWAGTSSDLYHKLSVWEMYYQTPALKPSGSQTIYGKEVELPEKSLAGQDDCAQFYFLKSIDVQDIASSSRTLIEPGTGYLNSLVNKEVLPDDYDSHDTIISSYSYAYNQRMNLTGITKKLFEGFNPISNFVYVWANLPASIDTVKIYVYIRQNGKEYVVESPSTQLGHFKYRGYFFYPNPNAYKVVIAETSGGTTTYYEEKLKIHPFLNGAYFFKTSSSDTTVSTAPVPSSSRDVPLPNKLYTSEVGNPFLYPVTNINTIGLGAIIGMAAASKALSQGQFGQYPLYVFTDEGIWAMSVSDTGTFSAKQTISRDVCLNAKSITQIDSAVLFATERGLMIIQGSTVECFSDQVNNIDDAQFNYGTFTNIASALIPSATDRERFNICDFREYISNCGMLYDYRSQRLIVFNPAKSYAYIFGMDGNKQWSMMRSSIQYSVNSYPEAFAVDSSARLLDFSKRVANGYDSSGLSVLDQHLCTRPLKLDYADILKTVDTVIQRGNFERGHVRSAIFGSRDLINWFPIYTSTDHYLRGFSGTPYKYFRIALSSNLRDHESLTGCTVQFTPRETNSMK